MDDAERERERGGFGITSLVVFSGRPGFPAEDAFSELEERQIVSCHA